VPVVIESGLDRSLRAVRVDVDGDERNRARSAEALYFFFSLARNNIPTAGAISNRVAGSGAVTVAPSVIGELESPVICLAETRVGKKTSPSKTRQTEHARIIRSLPCV
jgi:hypothetical protein